MIAVSAEQIVVTERGRTRLGPASVHVRPGDVHALIGANGSGKSTLLNVLAGELRATAGEVRIRIDEGPEESWDSFSATRAARCRALLAQDTPITFPFSVADVVRWGRLPWRDHPQREEDEDVLREEVEANDIGHLLGRRITELSGGERARVHLARVLSQRAPLLLLDEADATLDLAGQAHLDSAIERRRTTGDTIVVVSHDLTRVAGLADTVTVLKAGRSIAEGDVSSTMTAEILSEAYGIPVEVTNSRGSLIIRRP